jgi:hypothetical protein
LFDDQGSVRSVAQREFTQIFPQPGWVEHDPQEIAASQMAVAIEVLETAGVQRGEVAELRTSARRPSFGIARAASRFTTPLCGRIGERRDFARSLRQEVTRS